MGGSGKEWEGWQTEETAEAKGSSWHTHFFWNIRFYCASTGWTTRYSTYQRMRKGITEQTSVRSWRIIQEGTMRMQEQWVRDNNLPLTRYGKCIIRATHLFPYPWSFQLLTVLADEESGVKQWSICEWRRRGSLSMGKACSGCGDRYKHGLLRVRLKWKSPGVNICPKRSETVYPGLDWYLHCSCLPLHLPSSLVENPKMEWDLILNGQICQTQEQSLSLLRWFCLRYGVSGVDSKC